MKAMILAAGLGTRLKPLTDKIPKALVEVDGVPMLERVILRLKNEGFDKIVINIHHFADQIKEFLAAKDFMIHIQISDETGELLDTGGGIVKAFDLLFKDDTSPVLFHNVDILSDADLKGLMVSNMKREGGSTLLVNNRESSRKLIFNSEMKLEVWHDLKGNSYRWIEEPHEEGSELAFSGIYIMSKKSVEEMKGLKGIGKFSVMEYFLSPKRKERVEGYNQNGLRVIDIGKPTTLLRASGIFRD